MIMPVVESTANIEGLAPVDMLAQLGVSAPNLQWNLYRDMLIHGDELTYGFSGEKGSPSMIIVTSPEDEVLEELQNDYRVLDVGSLYRRLLKHLESEITKSKDQTADVIVGIEYDKSSKRPEIIAILREIDDGYDGLLNSKS
jgi:hypothetical protein